MDADASQTVFTARVVHLDGDAEILVAGELDLATVTVLQQVLDAVFAQGQVDIRLNASTLTFLDAAGIGCLIEARQRALELGGDLRVHSLSGAPRRVLQLFDLLATFGSGPGPLDDERLHQVIAGPPAGDTPSAP